MITFISAFYILKSKFSKEKYEKWFSNFLPNVKKFNLVIFCDQKSKHLLEKYTKNNDKIKLVLLEIEKFYNYKYKTDWIKNHTKNKLAEYEDWQLNMLWSEKISFVKNAYINKYFPETEWYGWCDIGYFRGDEFGDISQQQIKNWPNYDRISSLSKDKIYYALVRFNPNYLQSLYNVINDKNEFGLPRNSIPEDQWSIAGGFFLIYKNKIDYWFKTFDNRLQLYFKHNYLVKDDQILVVDLIFSNKGKFELIKETNRTNPWFVFQRFLL